MRHRGVITWLSQVLCWFLAGCCANADSQPISATGTYDLPTSFSFTHTPEASATPMASPFPTLLPMLPFPEAQALILEYLATNNGCDLPCWWGATPGLSDWNDMRPVFEPMASRVSYTTARKPGLFVVELSFFDMPEDITAGYLNFMIAIEQGIVQSVHALGFEKTPTYKLTHLLEHYGPPNEVWVHTYRSYRDIDPPMDVLLFYQNRGILARYPSSEEEILNNSIIQGCFSNSPVLFLWASGQPMTFREAADTFGLDYYKWDKPIMPLEEATGMTVETFYETYRDPANDPCIETPRDLWPDP